MATVAEAGQRCRAHRRLPVRTANRPDQSAADGISAIGRARGTRGQCRTTFVLPTFGCMALEQELAEPLPGGTTRHGPQVVRVKKQ